MYGCIRLVGGVALTPNMKERMQREIRTLVPTQYEVDVQVADDPVHDAWVQAKAWIQGQGSISSSHSQWSVSRDEYEMKPNKGDAPHKRPWHRLLDKKIFGKLV
jgi:actin-related protein